jgi:hypothetical protein
MENDSNSKSGQTLDGDSLIILMLAFFIAYLLFWKIFDHLFILLGRALRINQNWGDLFMIKLIW